MSAIEVIEAAATYLWTYAGLTILAWVARFVRLDRLSHIPAVTDFLLHLVPTMVVLVVVVLFGALFGFPTTIVVIALLFPGGLAYGAQSALSDLREGPDLQSDLLRLAVAIALGTALVILRMAPAG